MKSVIWPGKTHHWTGVRRPLPARLTQAVRNSLRTATYAFGLGLLAGLLWHTSQGTLRPVFAFICLMNLGAAALMVLAVLAALRAVRRGETARR